MEIKECYQYLKQEDVSILKEIETGILDSTAKWTDERIKDVTDLLNPFIPKMDNNVDSASKLIERDVTYIKDANELLIPCQEAHLCLTNIALKAQAEISCCTVNVEQLLQLLSDLIAIGENFNILVKKLHIAIDSLEKCKMTKQKNVVSILRLRLMKRKSIRKHNLLSTLKK